MDSRLPDRSAETLTYGASTAGISLVLMALAGLMMSGGIAAIAYLLGGIDGMVMGGGLALTLAAGIVIRRLALLDQPRKAIDFLDPELVRMLCGINRRAMLVTGLSGNPVSLNSAFERLTGSGAAGLHDLIAGEAAHRSLATLVRNVRQTGEGSGAFPLASDPAQEITLRGRRTAHYMIWEVSVDSYEARLEQERERLAGFAAPLFDRIQAGIVLEDKTGRLIAANQTVRDWLGITPDDPLPASLPLDHEGRHLKIGRRRDMAVRSVTHELTTREKDRHIGRYRFLISAESLRQRPGREDGAILIDPMLDTAPVSVAVADRAGTVRETNATMKGASIGRGLKDGDSILNIVHEEDRAELKQHLELAATGEIYDRPIDVRFNVQPERVGQIYFSNVATEKEQLAILYFLDTTQEKSLERQFVQAQKMQAVGQLAGGVAHDFNNLLTAILGFCDLLLVRHDAGDQSFSDIMQIKQNANRAANLVRQLLAFSRQQTLRPKVLLITDILAEVSNLIRRLIGETIELKVVHGRDLMPVKVDQGQLEQVIINLAVNARDAMPEGGRLEIRTSAISADDPFVQKYDIVEPGDYVLIEFEDTGCGIPKEVIGKIFEPFFTTKEVGQGTGLGLATVYGIVKQTGGYVFVESEVGVGTTFYLLLKGYAQAGEEVVKAQIGEDEGPARDLTGKGVILIVEDEDPVRMFASRALANKGYTILEANSGEAGLEVIESHDGPIDLLISDVVMPNMDGPTLVKTVRETMPHLPVIFVSGYAEDVFRQNLEAEDFHFLPKPFSLKDLAEKVKSILG
ncbi:ATP-binding protein [Gimibacter soli]|uniref:histidine kinase n=1 Tax=Gimibacter soli TaxID=3024400 RepID=A0AAE9XRQ6_9PROT|nr:ATP-binding protein [Gimibacter soli]WCL52715.1 response regulator [Gimibacter soli]